MTTFDPAQARALRDGHPFLWLNGGSAERAPSGFSLDDVREARDRFRRFAPLLAGLFPELGQSGVIESPLWPAAAMQRAMALPAAMGRLWIKADHDLPIAGSIKARGGIHEVLQHAEELALRAGLLRRGDDYRALAQPAAREFFSRHQVAVGSTGNLGLSIGVIASALGFRAAVHMSADAKAWKKARLRARGVEVVEHAGDYGQAVASGRAQVTADPRGYFVDDERSASLFLGYAAAALHLREQFEQSGVVVDADHPLFVYLPCGVGGAPGGIAFGLSELFGRHVHAFFAEPTQSPCFLVRMAAGAQAGASVYDFGLSNRTEADGLAVAQASELAAGEMASRLAGVYTVEDDTLFAGLAQLHDSEGLRIEPSAAAGFSGPAMLCGTPAGQAYLRSRGLAGVMADATHLVWTTGGRFVPADEYDRFLARGRDVAERLGS